MVAWTVVEREMRVAVRRDWAWRGRALPAVFAIVALVWLLVFSPDWRAKDLGTYLFHMVSVLMYVVATLGGFYATSDCLSREHREGTMGLLFLTELGPVDVLAGKLVASSFRLLLGLIAVVPVLAVSLLAGGVTLEDIVWVSVVSLNMLFFSLAAGMLASSCYRESSKSFSMALAIVVFFVIGVPFLAGIGGEYWKSDAVRVMGFRFCPAYACVLLLRLPIGDQSLLTTLGCVQVVSWSFLGLSCWCLVRDLRGPVQSKRWRWLRWNPWKGSPEYRRRMRRELLDRNAYLWRCALPLRKPAIVWVVLGVIAAIYCGGWQWKPDYFANPSSFIFIMFMGALTLKLWVAIEAPHAMITDRQSGALELLATTPLQGRDLADGQIAALRRQFQTPVLVACAVALVFSLIMWHDGRFPQSHQPVSGEHFMVLAGLLVFIGDLITISYCSIAQATISSTENKIVAKTMVILILPWLFYGVIYWVAEDWIRGLRPMYQGQWSWRYWFWDLGLWVIVCLAWDALIILFSMSRLRRPLIEFAQIHRSDSAKPKP